MGNYNMLFAHPEALISSKFGREMLYSAPYQQHVCAIVIDEAHCISTYNSLPYSFSL